MPETRERLTAAMRQGRSVKNLSQAELADRVGASLEAISNIERGKSSPSVDLFARIVKVLDLDPRTVLCSPVEDLRTEERQKLEVQAAQMVHRLDDVALDAWIKIGKIVAGVVKRPDPQ